MVQKGLVTQANVNSKSKWEQQRHFQENEKGANIPRLFVNRTFTRHAKSILQFTPKEMNRNPTLLSTDKVKVTQSLVDQ